MEKLHKLSVHSLLNPSTSDKVQYHCHTTPLVEASYFENEKSHIKTKRKRIKLYGVELDVPMDMPDDFLMNNLQDQILLFSDFASPTQSSPLLLPIAQQHQDKGTSNPFYSFAALCENHSPSSEHKKTSSPQSQLLQTIQQDATSQYVSTHRNQFAVELPPIKTDLTQQAPIPNYNSPTAMMPSVNFQTEPDNDDEEFSSVFLSALKNGTPMEPTKNSQRWASIPPQEEVTYIGPHGHKIKVTKIQPSAKDPPIEVKLIVDDPKTNPFTQQWMEHFGELKKFKEQYGHTNVTRSIAGYYNLGNWVAEQRRKFKQGKITETQFNYLNDIGFEWDRSYYFFRTRHRKRDRSSDEEEDD